MSMILLNESSPGAPRNAGTNGDLCTLLDWALPQKSWAIEYSSGNARVYRPSIGVRNRLHVNHDSAVSGNAGLAVVRGCEGASGATTLVDPFPTVAQVVNANSNWLVSSAASTATRRFYIILTETFVIYFSNYNGNLGSWDWGYFGDPPGTLPGDLYATTINQRNNASTSTAVGLNQSVAPNTVAGGNVFWMRDLSGATKSTRGCINCSSSTRLGDMTSQPAARGGFLNAVYREKVGIGCAGGNTLNTMIMNNRGFLPNIWNPIHLGIGTLSEADTFEDLAYNALSVFRPISVTIGVTSPFLIMEETDTWVSP